MRWQNDRKMFFCAGRVDANGTKAFTSSSSCSDSPCSASNNVYQIKFDSSHPDGAKYVIQITGLGAVSYGVE